MDMDRIFYIFGSFSRKKDKRKSLQAECQQSMSAGSSPQHRHSQPAPCEHLALPPRTSAYGAAQPPAPRHLQCGLCHKLALEPRLLACLHSFCTRCLQGLHHEGEAELWSDLDGSIQLENGGSRSTSGAGSAGSGYESELRDHSGSDGSWPEHERTHKYGILTRKVSGKSVQLVVCPTCGEETVLPVGGVSALPLNYVLQRKVEDAQTNDRTSVLCDLCNTDNRAESRCSECHVSVCSGCERAHSRQANTARHALSPLTAHRPAYCDTHVHAERTVYCATCQEVICRDCCLLSHSGHALANAGRVAAERARQLRDACDRVKQVPKHAQRALKELDRLDMEVDCKATRLESEVREFTEHYRAEVERHCLALQAEVAAARQHCRRHYQLMRRRVTQQAYSAQDAVDFAEEVLAQSSPVAMLALGGAAARRAEQLAAPPAPAPPAPPPPFKLRLRTDLSENGLRGRLVEDHGELYATLQANCLQDLRVGVTHEFLVEVRGGGPGAGAGQRLAGYFRRKESSAAPQEARVRELDPGTYSVTVRPPAPGHYYLALTLNDKPIQGSPFLCSARLSKPAELQQNSPSRLSQCTPSEAVTSGRDSVYHFSL